MYVCEVLTSLEIYFSPPTLLKIHVVSKYNSADK